MVYADRMGNIGEISGALVPRRKKFNGLLPVSGIGGFEWDGFLEFDQLPQHFNPSSGFFATANHKMIPNNYPFTVGYDWSEFRIRRVREMFDASGAQRKLTMNDMMTMQNDVLSVPARELIALLPVGD
jgi:penicillin amidase